MQKRKFILSLTFLIVGVSNLIAQNKYLNYDGIDDYVQIPDNSNHDFSGDFTIETKFVRDSTSRREDILVKKDLTFSSSSNVVALYIHPDNRVCFYMKDFYSSTSVTLVSTSYTDSLSWNHIAVVRSGSSVFLYVDGLLESIDTMANDLTSNGPMRIGSNRVESLDPNSPISYPFDGSIDEVRIWNYSRSIVEIQNNISAELSGNESGLVGYYNFNQGVICGNNTAETLLTDNSSNSNDGILNNFDLTGGLSDPCESNWSGFSQNSIDDLDKSGFLTLYPNPTTSQVTIPNFQADISNVRILDVTGKLIKSFVPESDIIDVSMLQNGIYFVQIQIGSENYRRQIVKQ